MIDNGSEMKVPKAAKRKWNEDIGRAFGIIDEILYSFALNYEIRPSERDEKIYDPFLRKFWMTISYNAILMGIINWCKLFGAKGNNDMHFSHFVQKEHFFNKVNEAAFLEISKRMKNVRDKFAAHEDLKDTINGIPKFEEAITVMEAFRDTVQEEYDIPELPPVQGSYEGYQLQIRDCLKECRIDWELNQDDE